MKKLIILSLISLSVQFLSANNDLFTNKYNVFDSFNFTDEALITSVEGDDYFFGIENGQLYSKVKRSDSNYFVEFIPDFFYHNFTSVTYIESIRFSNDRDYLFFIGVENNVQSLNVLRFNDDGSLVYVEELCFMLSDTNYVENFNVFNSFGDNAHIIFSSNKKIYYIAFNNNFKIQTYSHITNIDITGKVIEVLKHNFTYNNLLIHCVNNEKNELWMLKIDNNTIEKMRVTGIIDFDNINFEIINNNSLYSIENKEYKDFLVFDFYEMTFDHRTLKRSEIESGFCNLDGDIIYCLKHNNNYFKIPDLKQVIDLNSNDEINNLLLYSEESYIYKEDSEAEYFVINNFIMKKEIDLDRNKFTLYYANNLNPLEITTFYTSELLHGNNIKIINDNFININNSAYYFYLDNQLFFKSDIIPIKMNNYIFYKINDCYQLEMIDVSL